MGVERTSRGLLRCPSLHEAIIGYQALHPGCRRADAIDAVLLSPQVGELHKAERRVMELQKAKNTLPQPRSTADIDFSSPLRGTSGYDRTKDARPPHNPDSGENPIIRDHHQVLDDIKSGKLLWNDPKVQALVALERKRIFEND